MHGGVPGASIPLLWDHLAEEHPGWGSHSCHLCKKKNTGQSSKQSLWMSAALFIKYCLCLVLGEHTEGVQWLFVGKCWLCIFGCLLGCLGMSLQSREKSTWPPSDICQNHFPLTKGWRWLRQTWKPGRWRFHSGGTVEPEVTEEPRNEELVPPGLKCSVRLSPQHVGGYTSSPLCPATPVSPWYLDRHDIIRQRSLFVAVARNFSWDFFLRRPITRGQKPLLLLGSFPSFTEEWKRLPSAKAPGASIFLQHLSRKRHALRKRAKYRRKQMTWTMTIASATSSSVAVAVALPMFRSCPNALRLSTHLIP